MVKRVLPSEVLVSPGLADAPVMDLMCSHLVLSLTAKQGSKFNVRRDLGSLFALTGRHLVWPAPVLGRVRAFLARRCCRGGWGLRPVPCCLWSATRSSPNRTAKGMRCMPLRG